MKPIRRTLQSCALALILPCAVSGLLQADEKTDQKTDGKETPTAAGSSAPSPTSGPEQIVVEGTPPYIPTTNTIATRLPLVPRFTPAHLGTVTEPLLRDQYALVLGDALRNISGVNVQTQSGIADYFLVRGYSSLDSGLVLVDGATEPEVPFFQMYNVSRVEVLKGPGGFLYGRNPLSGALAGVVNIVRKQPEPGIFGRAGGTFGSFGTFEAVADYNFHPQNASTGFRINAMWRESDFYRDDKESRNYAVNPSFSWRPTGRSSLNVNLELIDTSYSPDSGLPLVNNEIPDVPRTRSYQSPFDDSDQRIGRFQVDYEAKAGEAWTLRDKLYHRDLDWESRGTIFIGTFPNPLTMSTDVYRILTLLDDRQRITGNLLEAERSASTGPIKHTFLLGLDTVRYGDESFVETSAPPPFPGSLPPLDVYDPMETATSEPPTFPFDRFDTTSTVVAPYLVDQIELHRRFQVMLGARFDWLRYDDDADGTRIRERELSPMAGIVWTPADAVTFYGNFGRSFGPPPARVSAPNREPRESTQTEAGVKLHTRDGKVQTTIAAYRLDLESFPISDGTGVTQNTADQESRGVELEVSAEPLPGLRGFFSYAWNDSELTRYTERILVVPFPPVFLEFDRTGNRPAFAPEHIMNLWVSKRFDSGFGFGGGGRYVSDQFIWEDNVYESDAYVTVDAALFYTVKDFDLHLNVKNLTDTEYETRSIGSGAVIPADGLAVYGGVNYRF